ncbi:hypothetical protein GH714_042589 [Hevea brasiliensis]|uniref:Uncharacterized protein n=1 Tax=Hevea brasiliensis TaxID=3981 RepID=A0A6A6JZY2_HEVBR|nr:hypothetical protein GH714_042589 [Hevea brasiliensis]
MTIDVVTTTRAKQSASTETAQSGIESEFKAVADEAQDITRALSASGNIQEPQNAAPSPTAVDQGNETATSPSPSTEGDGSVIQSGSVQHATGSSATLKLKSAPDQAMRDAVLSPWSLINAGEHHSNNSRNAKSGDIREFCSKYLCRGTDKREGLLNFIKASRVVGPTSSDPSQVASVVLTETHDFVVLNTNNMNVGTLEAEVQYTVTTTIEQDKYKVSDLTVKIKSTDSTDPELTYTSTNTSEVSLPKPEAITAKEGQQNSGGSAEEEHDQQTTGTASSGTGSDEKEATAHGEDAPQVGQVSSPTVNTSWSTFSGAAAHSTPGGQASSAGATAVGRQDVFTVGKMTRDNSRNARTGYIRECYSDLCRGTYRDLLNLLKALFPNLKVVPWNNVTVSTCTRSTHSDPNKVASIAFIEKYNFTIRGTNNKEVGTLEAEVQYTVTPTIGQGNGYKVIDPTVKIKSTDPTGPELTLCPSIFSTLGGTGAGTGTSGIDQTLAAGYAGTGLSQRSSGTDGTGAGTGTSGIDQTLAAGYAGNGQALAGGAGLSQGSSGTDGAETAQSAASEHGATSAAGATVQAPSSAALSSTSADQGSAGTALPSSTEGNEAATSPSPGTEGDGGTEQQGNQDAAAESGSSATFTPNDTKKEGTAVPAESGSSKSTANPQEEKLRTAFSSGKVQDVVKVLLSSNDERVQILAHVSNRTTGSDGSPHIDKRYVARVTSDSNGTTEDFYVHLVYKLPRPGIREHKVRDVHLKVRQALNSVSIDAPSGGLVLDTVWKPDKTVTTSGSTPATDASSKIYAHDAIRAPINAFNKHPMLECKLTEVDLAEDIHGMLLTDAYVYQNTVILHRDTQTSVVDARYNKVMNAVAETLYYADTPDIRPILTRLAEYSIMHCGIMEPGSGNGNTAIEQHYVFRIANRSNKVPPCCNIHAFVSGKLASQQDGAARRDQLAFAVRLVHAPKFRLSLFLAASHSAKTHRSRQKQQFVMHGGAAPVLQVISEQDDGSTTQLPSTGGTEGNGGAAQSGEQGGTEDGKTGAPGYDYTLPIIVVNNYEQDLKPIDSSTPEHVVKYLKNVIKGHAVSEEMNEALVESLVRISPTGSEGSKRADAGFDRLLQDNSVKVNGSALTNAGGSSALSALRGALNWKSGATDLLRAVINTCDTTYNGFTVVYSDGTLNRIQPVIKQQVLDLKADNSATPGSKAEIVRDLRLKYEIGGDAFETSVKVQYELSLNTHEDGRTELAVANIQAAAAPVAGSSSPRPVAPTTLSYSWCKNEVVSDLSQLSATGCTPSLAISACIGQHGLGSVFLLPGSGSGFSLTRNAAKESISKFYSNSTGATTTLGTISNQALRNLGLQLFRKDARNNTLEISKLLSAISKHLAVAVCEVTKTNDKTHKILGIEGEGVIAGARVEQDYKMSMHGNAKDIVVRVVYDVLLVESEFTYTKGLTKGINTDYVVCNLKVGCAVASQAGSLSMMEFPVPMMTVLSAQRAVSQEVAAAMAREIPKFNDGALALPEVGGTGTSGIDQTLGGTDQHGTDGTGAGTGTSGIDGAGTGSEHGTEVHASGTDGTGAGTLKRNGSSISAAPQARSEQDKLSRTLLDTKSTGLWLQNGEFRNENDIALILSNSDLLRAVLFPKKVSAEEYTSHVISRMAEICLGCSNASSLIIKNVSSNAKLEDPQKRLYKVVKTADVSVAGSSDVLGVSVEYKVSKKTHRQGRRRGGSSYTAVCAITNAKLTIKQLDADGVARTSATFGIPNTKSRSLEKVDNASTVNLRDFTTLQRTKQKPNTYDSGAEKFGNYAHLLQSPIDNADETQEDERMQEDIGPRQ